MNRKQGFLLALNVALNGENRKESFIYNASPI